MLLNALIDLPFALSPVVIGLSLLLVYGTNGRWIGGFLDGAGIQRHLRGARDGPGDDVRVACRSSCARWCRCCARSAPTRRRPRTRWARRSWRTFWRVTLPAIRWGIVYGVVLTTARALGEFGAVDDRVRPDLGQDRDADHCTSQERYEAFDLVGGLHRIDRVGVDGALVLVACAVRRWPATVGVMADALAGSTDLAPREDPDGHQDRRAHQAVR